LEGLRSALPVRSAMINAQASGQLSLLEQALEGLLRCM